MEFECERRLNVLCVDKIGNIIEFFHILSQPGVDPNIREQVRHELQSVKLMADIVKFSMFY